MSRSVSNPQAIDINNPATPDIGGSGFSNPYNATLQINGTNILYPPTYLEVFSSTTQSIGSGNVQIEFDTISRVSTTWGNVTLPAMGFIAPFTGVYIATLKVYWNSGTTGVSRASWLVTPNDSNNYCYAAFHNIGSSTCASSASDLFFLNEGQTAFCYAQQNDSASSVSIGDNNEGTLDGQTTILYVRYLGVN